MYRTSFQFAFKFLNQESDIRRSSLSAATEATVGTDSDIAGRDGGSRVEDGPFEAINTSAETGGDSGMIVVDESFEGAGGFLLIAAERESGAVAPATPPFNSSPAPENTARLFAFTP